MLKVSGHSGVQGYIIKNIKNQINSALQVRLNRSHANLNCVWNTPPPRPFFFCKVVVVSDHLHLTAAQVAKCGRSLELWHQPLPKKGPFWCYASIQGVFSQQSGFSLCGFHSSLVYMQDCSASIFVRFQRDQRLLIVSWILTVTASPLLFLTDREQ